MVFTKEKSRANIDIFMRKNTVTKRVHKYLLLQRSPFAEKDAGKFVEDGF